MGGVVIKPDVTKKITPAHLLLAYVFSANPAPYKI